MAHAPCPFVFSASGRAMNISKPNCFAGAICIKSQKSSGNSPSMTQKLPSANQLLSQLRVCFLRCCGDVLNPRHTENAENRNGQYPCDREPTFAVNGCRNRRRHRNGIQSHCTAPRKAWHPIREKSVPPQSRNKNDSGAILVAGKGCSSWDAFRPNVPTCVVLV